MDLGQCTICDKPLTDDEKKAHVHYLGLQGLIEKSKKVQDEKWKEWEKLDKEQYLTVHETCRKRYRSQTDKPLAERQKRKLADHTKDDINEPPAKPFDYETLCMLCDKPLDSKHKKVHVINTQMEQTSIVEWSKSTDDEHAKEIVRRIKYVRDNSITGMYHESCRRKCRINEPYIPKTDIVAIEKAVETVTNYIENSGEYKFEISKFRKIMEESDVLVLSNYALNRKLEEKYGDDILIVQHIGRSPVYFYKANNLFDNSREWLTNPQFLSDFEKSIIMKVSADIIKHEVLHKQNEISTNESALETFADHLLQDTSEINKNIKRDSITQTVIRALRLKNFIPAPALKKIFCYCTGDCSSSRCTCKKTSSECSHLCKNCDNESCTNYPLVQLPVQVQYENFDENIQNVNNDGIRLPSFKY